MKVLVIGMNPSGFARKDGGPSPTFKKLERWINTMGVKHFSFANVVESSGVCRKTDIDYNRLRSMVETDQRVIALGRFASEALVKINVAHFKLPHPSPRNRLLNDKTFETSIVQKCKDFLC